MGLGVLWRRAQALLALWDKRISPSRSVLQRSVQFGFPEEYCARVGGATAEVGACLGLQAAFGFLLSVIGRTCPLKDTPNGSPPKWDYNGGVALYVKCKPSNPPRFPKVEMGFKYSGGLHFGYAFEGAS